MSVKGSKNGTFFDYEGFVEKFEPKKTGEYMPSACGMENIAEIPDEDSDELQGTLFASCGGEEA